VIANEFDQVLLLLDGQCSFKRTLHDLLTPGDYQQILVITGDYCDYRQ
jgi:hypothetical protein